MGQICWRPVMFVTASLTAFGLITQYPPYHRAVSCIQQPVYSLSLFHGTIPALFRHYFMLYCQSEIVLCEPASFGLITQYPQYHTDLFYVYSSQFIVYHYIMALFRHYSMLYCQSEIVLCEPASFGLITQNPQYHSGAVSCITAASL